MFQINRTKLRKGQSTLEYVILIIIIMGALMSIQVYIKRGLQGRMKQATDDIGDQYSVGNTSITKNVWTNSKTHETFDEGVKTTETEEDLTTEQYDHKIEELYDEGWGDDGPGDNDGAAGADAVQ